MPEYIDREALLEKRWDVPFETGNAHFVQVVDVGDILDAPVEDVAPVRHGRWQGSSGDTCSVCGEECFDWSNMRAFLYPYCPYCGAKMDGGAD